MRDRGRGGYSARRDPARRPRGNAFRFDAEGAKSVLACGAKAQRAQLASPTPSPSFARDVRAQTPQAPQPNSDPRNTMSIQPFGATQRNLFVRPGTTTTTSAKAAASATNATSSQPAAGTPDVASASPTEPAMRRRIENYLDHADKRIDHMLEHGDLSPRQQEALKNAQESFHAQMGRLDRALDGGEGAGRYTGAAAPVFRWAGVPGRAAQPASAT